MTARKASCNAYGVHQGIYIWLAEWQGRKHYAAIAGQEKCEIFIAGCEMVQSERRDQEWRGVIAGVREVYTGLVIQHGQISGRSCEVVGCCGLDLFQWVLSHRRLGGTAGSN
ncbi:hypothetical protein J7E78_24135 [Paenibacillus polymyxa]|nr:hypothetical protein [Paenibacillus polymyxa]MBT2286617.1 hypothetical protein [Paenibacillus polymyxa]